MSARHRQRDRWIAKHARWGIPRGEAIVEWCSTTDPWELGTYQRVGGHFRRLGAGAHRAATLFRGIADSWAAAADRELRLAGILDRRERVYAAADVERLARGR